MAAQADANFPITVDLFVDGYVVPHALAHRFPRGVGVELSFTTPHSHWIHPHTGKPEFPLRWCPTCKKERVIFRMMCLEQPVKPGPIFFALTDVCDQCTPRPVVHLLVHTEGQEFRFRQFFYADGSPIKVRDPQTGTIHGTEEMDFRGVMYAEEFFIGERCRLVTMTQPYKLRGKNRPGAAA